MFRRERRRLDNLLTISCILSNISSLSFSLDRCRKLVVVAHRLVKGVAPLAVRITIVINTVDS